MAEVYVLWGSDNQSLTTVFEKLFDGINTYSLSGNDIPNVKNIDPQEYEAVVITLLGDQRIYLEALRVALEKGQWGLARIIGVLDVAAYHANHRLSDWVKMISHFSDVLLLDNLTDVPASFISELQRRWKDRPMLISHASKAGANAAEILVDEARRLSQYFEPLDDEDLEFHQGDILDDEDDDEQSWDYEESKAPKKVQQIKLKDINDKPEDDPYFKCNSDGEYAIKVLLD